MLICKAWGHPWEGRGGREEIRDVEQSESGPGGA